MKSLFMENESQNKCTVIFIELTLCYEDFKTACDPVKQGLVGSTPTYSRYLTLIVTICYESNGRWIVTKFVTHRKGQRLKAEERVKGKGK